MTELQELGESLLDEILLCRRFSREQGVKADGSVKLRAIDDLTGNGANGTAEQEGKVRMDDLDELVEAIRAYYAIRGELPRLWKADIDAAFRRVPIKEDDRWAAWVAFLLDGKVLTARHIGLMFGSVGSVHGWGRVGALIRHVAREWLMLPVLRYVDDYFSTEGEATAAHALSCFARLVRTMLGGDALAEAKTECGRPLTILGIQVDVEEDGITLELTEQKRQDWGGRPQVAMDQGALAAGVASRFAGKLSFAALRCFSKIGRVMARPFQLLTRSSIL